MMQASDFRRLRQCAIVVAFVRSGSMDIVYKLLYKTVRFCTCFRRKKAKGALCQPRAPIPYDINGAAPSLQDLQEFCLAALVENVSSLDKEAVDCLPVDLAQRLFDCLAARRLVTFDILSLFEDQHLDHVSLYGVQAVNDSWLSVIMAESVSRLDISYCYQLSNQGIQILKAFTKLEILHLDFLTHLTDEGLIGMGSLVQLRELSFKGCNALMGIGLMYLSSLQSLTWLSFELCSSLTTGLYYVGKLRKLEHLNFGWCVRLSMRELGEIRALVNLTELIVNGTRECIRGLPRLTLLRKLKKLGLSGVCIHKEEMDMIGGYLEGLEELDLERAVFEPTHLEILPKLKQLKTINLAFTGIRGRSLQFLAEMDSLTEVNLDSCRVNDRGLTSLTNLTRLKKLILTDTNIRDPGVELILRLTTLETLNLAYTEVRDPGLEKLSRLVRLTDLNLDSRMLTDAAMKHLSTLTSLTKLDMFAARLKDESLKNLIPLTKLRFLEMCGGLFTNQACAILSGLPNLTYLNLAQNARVNSVGAKMLTKLTNLVSLNLSGTSIANNLLPHYSGMDRLSSLSVYNTGITAEEEVQQLSQQLPYLRVAGSFTNNN